MHPDNPYAAPQTVDSRRPLPVAESLDARMLFPEWDTARVTRLADYGHALRQMTNLCTGIVALLTIGFSAAWLRAGSAELQRMVLLYGTLLVAPFALRVWWGMQRASWMRPWGMFFDGVASVLIVFAVFWGFWATIAGQIHVGLLILVLGLGGFLLLHTAASFLAHVHAHQLFGPDRIALQDLAREADYRRRHGIG
jgi:hypothetical protein